MSRSIDAAVVGAGWPVYQPYPIVVWKESVSGDRPGKEQVHVLEGQSALLWFSFEKLIDMHGPETAQKFYHEAREGRDWLKNFIKQEKLIATCT